jgi:hypothetical protein
VRMADLDLCAGGHPEHDTPAGDDEK